MNKLEEQPYFEAGRETMKLPKIRIETERGEILLSILLKGYDQNWGGHKHALAIEIENFFQQNPLEEKSVEFLHELEKLNDDSFNEELLYEIALTLDKSERENAVVEFISKYKFLAKDFNELREGLLAELRRIENALPESLNNNIKSAIDEDIEKRNINIEETRKRIEKLIIFFKPNVKTTKIKQITILPTDFLYHEESGTSFEFDDLLILRSHIDNPDGLSHEFLHSVINPIVDKLAKQLTEEQKQKISDSGSYKLRVEEGYGNGFYSLLCEELIRTFNDVIQKGEKPFSYEDFIQRINEIDEDQFMRLLEENEKFRNRCAQLEIMTLDDMIKKSREYYDRFGEGELRHIVYAFYQNYIQEKEKNSEIIFEDFVLKEFQMFINSWQA